MRPHAPDLHKREHPAQLAMDTLDHIPDHQRHVDREWEKLGTNIEVACAQWQQTAPCPRLRVHGCMHPDDTDS